MRTEAELQAELAAEAAFDALAEKTGNAVYAATTKKDRAHLRAAIRRAIASMASGDEGDDWLCALGNAGHWPGWTGRVTNELLREACVVLAHAKASPWTEPCDWSRLLGGAFGNEGRKRLDPLYAGIPVRTNRPTPAELQEATMHPAPYRKLRSVYDTYRWSARAGRHAPGVTPERVREIAADAAEMAARFRLVLPHDTASAFYLREDLEARTAAFEAEGVDWREGVD